jgi:hypothetical protein
MPRNVSAVEWSTEPGRTGLQQAASDVVSAKAVTTPRADASRAARSAGAPAATAGTPAGPGRGKRADRARDRWVADG